MRGRVDSRAQVPAIGGKNLVRLPVQHVEENAAGLAVLARCVGHKNRRIAARGTGADAAR